MKKYVLYAMVFLTGMLSGYSLLPQRVTVERCSLDHSKDYEVACILNDICHMAMDYEDEYWREAVETGDFSSHLYAGFEDLYYDIIQNLDCYGTEGLTMKDFEGYVWAY